MVSKRPPTPQTPLQKNSTDPLPPINLSCADGSDESGMGTEERARTSKPRGKQKDALAEQDLDRKALWRNEVLVMVHET